MAWCVRTILLTVGIDLDRSPLGPLDGIASRSDWSVGTTSQAVRAECGSRAPMRVCVLISVGPLSERSIKATGKSR
jgi:hypothetical protein